MTGPGTALFCLSPPLPRPPNCILWKARGVRGLSRIPANGCWGLRRSGFRREKMPPSSPSTAFASPPGSTCPRGTGYQGPRPLVYYVHGGPQSQERPDFAWFSMPLIQFLTLQRLRRLRAQRARQHRLRPGLHEARRPRLGRPGPARPRPRHDQGAAARPAPGYTRAGVVGRSYGGYMTLTLAGRHPELWSAAVRYVRPLRPADLHASASPRPGSPTSRLPWATRTAEDVFPERALAARLISISWPARCWSSREETTRAWSSERIRGPGGLI